MTQQTTDGWVYVLSNPAMPDVVKVGYTLKTPDVRAAGMAHTGMPHPYKVEYAMRVKDPYDLERQTHRHLRAKHVGKECFRCTPKDAERAIQQMTGDRVIEQQSGLITQAQAKVRERQVRWEQEMHTWLRKQQYAIITKWQPQLDAHPRPAWMPVVGADRESNQRALVCRWWLMCSVLAAVFVMPEVTRGGGWFGWILGSLFMGVILAILLGVALGGILLLLEPLWEPWWVARKQRINKQRLQSPEYLKYCTIQEQKDLELADIQKQYDAQLAKGRDEYAVQMAALARSKEPLGPGKNTVSRDGKEGDFAEGEAVNDGFNSIT